jgi:hypothetical protein
MNWPVGTDEGVIVRLAGRAEFTVRSMVPVTPPRAAEIVVEPGETPVATPTALTVATPVAEEAQVTKLVRDRVLESE